MKNPWMRGGPLNRLALPGSSCKTNLMASHDRALGALKRGCPVAVCTTIEAGIGVATSELEGCSAK